MRCKGNGEEYGVGPKDPTDSSIPGNEDVQQNTEHDQKHRAPNLLCTK
ncbi:MAG: hypothetical protein R6V01_00655 [Thermoplasmatota archaeon]